MFVTASQREGRLPVDWAKRVRRWAVPVALVIAATILHTRPAHASDMVGILAVSPGVADVGSTVVVSGYGFSTVPTENIVTINGHAATVSAATDVSLDIVVPPGATSGPLSVVSPLGTAIWADLYVPPAPLSALDVGFTARLTPGGATSAVVADAGKVALLTIPGAAGGRVSLRLTASTFGASTSSALVSVLAPMGPPSSRPSGSAVVVSSSTLS